MPHLDHDRLSRAAEHFPSALLHDVPFGGDRAGRRAFEAAIEYTDLSSLGDLADDPGALEDELSAMSAATRARVLEAIAIWLEGLLGPSARSAASALPAAGASANLTAHPIAPADSAAGPPDDLAGARAWATQRQVEVVLDEPLTALRRPGAWLPRGYADDYTPLSELFEPRGRGLLTAGLRKADCVVLRKEAQGLLVSIAATRAERASRREKALAQALRDLSPSVQRYDERLAELEAQLRATGTSLSPLVVGFPIGEAKLVDRGLAYVDVRTEMTGRGTSTRLSLPPRDIAPLPAELDLRGHASLLAAVAWLRDLLRDPVLPVAADIRAWLEVPAWTRALARMSALETGSKERNSSATSERLAFRVSSTTGAILRVEAVVQKVSANGAFSAGRKTPAGPALEHAHTPLEERIVQALHDLERQEWSVAKSADARRLSSLLSLLAEHPRVFGGDSARSPLRFVKSRLRVNVSSTDDGFAVALSLGASPISAEAALAATLADGTLAWFDSARGQLVLARLEGPSSWFVTALAEFPSVFPHEAAPQLVGLLEQAQDQVDLELADALLGRPVDASARPIVRADLLPDGTLRFSVHVRPLVGGPLVEPGSGAARIFGLDAEGRVSARRDLDVERAAREHLLSALPLGDVTREVDGSFHVEDPDRAADVIVALADQSDALVEWPAGPPPTVARATRRELRLQVVKQRDWFAVNGEIDLAGAKVALAALLVAARSGHRFVRLSKDKIVALADDLRARLRSVDDVVHVNARGGAIEASQLSLSAIDALVEDEGQIRAAREWSAARARMRAAETFEPTVPAGLQVTLRPYQADGFRWLARLSAWAEGACLADDMGLGKTVQALALLLHREAEGPALVVAPTTVAPNWIAEAKRFAPSLRFHAYRGSARGALLADLRAGDVLVASYDVVARDIVPLAEIAFGTLVLDEAQAVKNARTRRAGALRDLRAGFRVALSGTPIENHLGELWSLFHAISPALLGSWDRFRDRFATAIERDRDAERRHALVTVVRPFLLRRTKRSVAPELPSRTETVRLVTLSAGERLRYESERLAAVHALAAADPVTGRFAMLAAITRLRRLACSVKLIDDDTNLASSKLACVLETVAELRAAGHRALVFSQFTSHLALVREALDGLGVAYEYLDGQTPASERERLVAAFQGGRGDLFLLSLKAGGTGINLTAADYVLHLDPWWNPAAEDQATDRAHRIGQSKPVTVIRFVAKDTIEEAVLALHDEKRELAESLLSGGDLAAKLTSRELLDLVRRGELEAGDAEEEAEG